jgi:hypothetical protein
VTKIGNASATSVTINERFLRFCCCTEEQEQEQEQEQEKKGALEIVSELGLSIRKQKQLTIFPSPLRTIFTFSKIRAI